MPAYRGFSRCASGPTSTGSRWAHRGCPPPAGVERLHQRLVVIFFTADPEAGPHDLTGREGPQGENGHASDEIAHYEGRIGRCSLRSPTGWTRDRREKASRHALCPNVEERDPTARRATDPGIRPPDVSVGGLPHTLAVMARRWGRDELLVAFSLYCRIPFGKLHRGNPEIIRMATAIGRTPSALAMKLTNIASLDPAVRASGRKGLQNASRADRAMWAEMEQDWQRFAEQSDDALVAVGGVVGSPGAAGRKAGEDRVAVTTRRVGQDFFRRAVLAAYDGSCCVTGLAVPDLLVASHIVPWSEDPTNRCNPRNGLALSALHDKAFDRGLISISADLTVLVSPQHRANADRYFETEIQSLAGKRIRPPDRFLPDPHLLEHHRRHVFQR